MMQLFGYWSHFDPLYIGKSHTKYGGMYVKWWSNTIPYKTVTSITTYHNTTSKIWVKWKVLHQTRLCQETDDTYKPICMPLWTSLHGVYLFLDEDDTRIPVQVHKYKFVIFIVLWSWVFYWYWKACLSWKIYWTPASH